MKGGPLRTGVLGIAAIFVGYALFATWLGVHAVSYLDARDRATSRTTGRVVEDGMGDDLDIRVRWTDADHHTRVDRFAVYDTDRYAKGENFPVAYDPSAAHPQGFPADPEETATEDDLIMPILLGAVVAVLLTGIWLWRGLRFRLTSRRPGRPMTAHVRIGTRRRTYWRSPTTTWLELTTPQGGLHWQRVIWHPALHETPPTAHTAPPEPPATTHDAPPEPPTTTHRTPPALPVTVHGTARPGSRRPAVPVLPDGTRLVPLGRLRDHAPAGLFFDDAPVRTDLRDAFILPPDTAAAPLWHEGALTAALGTLLGTVAGLALTDAALTTTVAIALCGAALVTSSWALSAPQP
ncbi:MULTISPECIES: hypothetical protein [Streptomyces]|uniref:DUF3592 domain-containing protein n=2 Tax=Streptomyces TaxID=1883 RepID=A0ABV9IY38_9ACTN